MEEKEDNTEQFINVTDVYRMTIDMSQAMSAILQNLVNDISEIEEKKNINEFKFFRG